LSTLTLNSGTGTWNFNGGTVKNGTVSFADSSTLGFSGTGTFDGVTLGSSLTVPNSRVLQIKNGLTLDASTITLNSTSTADTYLKVLGTQTVSGTGEIALGGTSSNGAIYIQGTSGASPATLTVGSGITVRGKGEIKELYANDALVNQGTIHANVASNTLLISIPTLTNTGTLKVSTGTLRVSSANWTSSSSGNMTVEGGTFAANNNWDSTGAINVSGGTLTMSGDITNSGTWNRTGGTVNLQGVLDNTGNTLTLNASTGSWNLTGGTILGGAVATADGSSLLISSTGTLDGVTLNTDVNIPSLKTLTIKNGLTLNGTITLNSTTSANGELTLLKFNGTQTLSGTGSIVLDDSYNNNTIYAMDSSAATSTLTIESGITIRGRGILTSDVNSGGADKVINYGSFIADVPGQILRSHGYISMDNYGQMTATGGGYLVINASTFNNYERVSILDASDLMLSSATFNNYDTLEIAGSGVAHIGADDVDGAATTFGQTEITFSLDHAAIGVGEQYRVESSTDGVNFTTVETLSAIGPSYVADDLTPDTSYWFRFTAEYANGSKIVYSSSQVATTA
jgi:hypothetical protein